MTDPTRASTLNSDLHGTGDWPDGELNFARMILGERSWSDVPDEEVARRAETLLTAWMSGQVRMERPKLYDHYALPLLALLRRTHALEARCAELEGRLRALETAGSLRPGDPDL